MPGKRKKTMDIREIVRHLRQGRSDRAIAAATGVNRKTVGRYRVWAIEQGLLSGALPPLGELQPLAGRDDEGSPPPQNVSSVEPYREVVEKLRQAKVEMTAIHQRLQERGYTGSYSSVRRFVQRLEPPAPEVTVRVETQPGEEAQVDFGYAGRMIDPETGELRRAWAFVMVLSWSRHQYVEFVFDQTVATWLRLHRNAFEFLGGVPERVVIDNLKAGIAQVCFEEPEVQHAYRECAEHYGFLIGPCRPRRRSTRARSSRAACTTSSATSWRPRADDPDAGQPRRAALGGDHGRAAHPRHDQGAAAGAASRPSARRCGRCRPRPTTWPSGSR